MIASKLLTLTLAGLTALGACAGARAWADPPRRGFRPPDPLRRLPPFGPPRYRVLRPAPPRPDLTPRPLPGANPAVLPVLRAALPTEMGPHGEGNVYAPDVLFEGGTYRMWYGAQGKDGHDRIHLAVSRDGVHWTHRGVVLGNDEANHVNDPSVVRVGRTYFMFYTRAVVDVVDDISAATSPDGVRWTKLGPVLTPGGPGSWDALCVGRPSVLFEDNVFKMWYDGRKDMPPNAPGNVPKSATSTRGVGYATSPDGVRWTKLPDGIVHGENAGGVDVKKLNGVYVMAYESTEGTRVSLSADGITDWTPMGLWLPLSGRDYDRYGHVTPMMLVGPGGRLDSVFIGTATAPTWDRNLIARVRPTPAQLALIVPKGRPPGTR